MRVNLFIFTIIHRKKNLHELIFFERNKKDNLNNYVLIIINIFICNEKFIFFFYN
jgi:hypothetical protein